MVVFHGSFTSVLYWTQSEEQKKLGEGEEGGGEGGGKGGGLERG